MAFWKKIWGKKPGPPKKSFAQVVKEREKLPALGPEFASERNIRDFIKMKKLPRAQTPQECLAVAKVAEELWKANKELLTDPNLLLMVENKMKAYTLIRQLKLEGIISPEDHKALFREVNNLIVPQMNMYASNLEMQYNKFIADAKGIESTKFTDAKKMAEAKKRVADLRKQAMENWDALFEYEKEFLIPARGAALQFDSLRDMGIKYEKMRNDALAKRQEAEKNAEGWKQHAEAARQRRDKKAFDEAVKNLNSWNSITTSWDGRAKELVDGLNMINGYLKGMEKNVTMFKELWKGGR